MDVKSLELFGSVARDEAKADSDVDFLVEFSQPIGLLGFSRIRLYLEDIFRFRDSRCVTRAFA
ncbi:MAG: nucleotidyltransferase domain-containing protein [Coleofasciculus sp. C2-GNP5-27]